MKKKDLFRAILISYFPYECYGDAIQLLRKDIQEREDTAELWVALVKFIQHRALCSGEPLKFAHQLANQVLDENTDEEAYKWFDLMIRNVENPNGEIELY